MRLELHLFLWVTAGLALVIQLSGGVRLPEQVSLGGASIRAQIVDGKSGDPDINSETSPVVDRVGSVVYDPSVRPMFTVIAVSEAPAQVFVAPEVAMPPILKGVLGGVDGRRAVFSTEPGATDVVTVSPGETVTDYRIEQVGEDYVTAVSPTGEQVRFELRGAGEDH
jgi:hypothetical protein